MKAIKEITEELKGYEAEAASLRRDLHQIPEAGFEEWKTQAYIIRYLEELGYTPEPVATTGVALYIPGKGHIDETIAFRSDMDALSIEEATGVDYTSKHPGMMHACGHDGHMTMLLLFAKYLKEHPEARVRHTLLIFQPAEEGPGGADKIVASGILEKYNVSSIFGIHLFPFLEEGVLSTTPGPMMAMTTEFYIDVIGKSGHAADPDKAVDAIVATADYVSALQKVISRGVSPNESALLSIGTIRGGTRMNIVADKVSLSGTLRSYNEACQKEMKRRIIDMAKGIELMYHCLIEIRFVDMYPPVVNDNVLFDAIWPLCGDKETKTLFSKVMLGEDFSMYQKAVPGVFIGLGCGNAEKGFTHSLHTGCFNFDEKVLLRGVQIYLNILTRE